jgi:hypothetical protein
MSIKNGHWTDTRILIYQHFPHRYQFLKGPHRTGPLAGFYECSFYALRRAVWMKTGNRD